MRYPIDFKPTFDATLLFWIERFVRSKLNSLSNRQVKDADKLTKVITDLNRGMESLEMLKTAAKEARNAGLIGINTYFKPLEKLYLYLKPLGFASMTELDEELISDFLASQTGGLADATKKNYRMAMIGFFGFIDKQNQDDDSKSHLFRIELKNWGGLGGSSGSKLPVYMSEEEIDRFLHAIDTATYQAQFQSRNRLLIKLILYTGIRVGEALSIKKKDFIEEHDVYLIRILGKGNKHRVVMIKKIHIESYLKDWLQINQCKSDLLFCNRKNSALTQAYVSRMVENILLTAGIRKEKNGAHMLRHTFATLLYRRKKDLVLIQEALGHASLNTSRIYTHFDEDRLREAASIMDDF
jgi:integrase/recombinase XerD